MAMWAPWKTYAGSGKPCASRPPQRPPPPCLQHHAGHLLSQDKATEHCLRRRRQEKEREDKKKKFEEQKQQHVRTLLCCFKVHEASTCAKARIRAAENWLLGRRRQTSARRGCGSSVQARRRSWSR